MINRWIDIYLASCHPLGRKLRAIWIDRIGDSKISRYLWLAVKNIVCASYVEWLYIVTEKITLFHFLLICYLLVSENDR